MWAYANQLRLETTDLPEGFYAMAEEYGDSIRAQVGAAGRRDPAGLIDAGRRLVAAIRVIEGTSSRMYNSGCDERQIGSALLTGTAANLGANYRSRYARRAWSDNEPSPMRG